VSSPNVITVTVRSKNQSTAGFKAVENDARAMQDRVASASLQVAQANLRVERATKNLAATEEKYGKESLQAREKTVALQRARLQASQAAGKLERAEKNLADGVQDAGREMDSVDVKTGKMSVGMDGLGKVVGKATVAIGAAVAALGGLGAGFDRALDAWDAGAVLEAQLGALPADVVEAAGRAAAEVYADAWGESLREVGDAVRRVMLDMDVTTEAQMESVTERVLALAQTFDTEFAQITRGAGQLMRTGLADSADEALDVIARGFQLGADKVGDFMDTLEEYGTQFRNLGLDAETSIGLMVQGLQAGARNADVVADAIKEFAIEAVRGAPRVAKGLTDLGFVADDMAQKFAAGGDVSAAALDEVLDSLRQIEDPVTRNAIAVELFGTKAEDLGDALYALDPSEAAKRLGDFGDAAADVADKVGDTPRASIEKFKRALSERFTNALGESLQWLEVVFEKLRPALQQMSDLLLPRLESIWQSLSDTWDELVAAGLDKYLDDLAKLLGGAAVANLYAVLVAVEMLVKAFEFFISANIRSMEYLQEWSRRIRSARDHTVSFGRGVRSEMSSARDWVSALLVRVRGVPGEIGRAASGVYGRFTAPFRAAVNAISSWLDGLRSKVSSVVGSARSAVSRLSPLSFLGFEHGGVVGAQSGGPRSGWTMVGEHGRELVQLAPGSRVVSNPDTERMLSGGGQGGGVTVQLEWVGGSGGDEFLSWLRNSIRIRGGVSTVLGAA
jgi:hypothetical protein